MSFHLFMFFALQSMNSMKMALGPAAQELVGSDIEFPEFDPLNLSAKATDAQRAQ
jgi:hypothetical protein